MDGPDANVDPFEAAKGAFHLDYSFVQQDIYDLHGHIPRLKAARAGSRFGVCQQPAVSSSPAPIGSETQHLDAQGIGLKLLQSNSRQAYADSRTPNW
jgi:hypothetical protein